MILTEHNLAVVIPALNESATIADVIKAVQAHGVTALVVDDGSTDNTVELARAANALVVCHEQNRGYEPALGTGIETAIKNGFDFAVTFDADGQLDAGDLLRYMKCQESEQADIVVGIRD